MSSCMVCHCHAQHKSQVTMGVFHVWSHSLRVRIALNALDQDWSFNVLGLCCVTKEMTSFEGSHAKKKKNIAFYSLDPLFHAVFMHLKTTPALLILHFNKESSIFGRLHRTNLTAALCDTLSEPPAVFHEFLCFYLSWTVLFSE